MSIETRGQSAYDHQYRATILVTLRALAATPPPTRAIVEEQGGEDATVELDAGGLSSRVEVQVKTNKGDFDLNSLSSVLTHFPAHSDQGSLLERLADNSRSRLLLVAEARAKDETRGFLAPAGQLPAIHAVPPLVDDGIAELAQSIQAVYAHASTPLGKKRARACVALAAELTTGGRLVAALDRVFVWEQCGDRRVRGEIATALTLHPFRVPLAETELTLGELTDKVRAVRDLRADALPGIQQVLESHRGTRLRLGTLYLPRPDEDVIAQVLTQKGLLALTGHPKSGKTAFALERLDRLQAEGWRCDVFSDPGTALRFLHVADVQNRACLLDDPLETMRDDDLAWRLNKLREIGEYCRAARWIFLTARLETLRRIQPKYRPGTRGPAGFAWQDMTVREPQFALQLWGAMAQTVQLDSTLVARVGGLLTGMKVDALLQPGQLAHLAKSAPHELVGKTDAQLVALARFNAADIAAQLIQRTPRQQRFIAALGISCGSVEGIADAELAFVLLETNDRPAWIEDEGRHFSAKAISRGFPTYAAASRLEQADLDLGSELERLGYVERREGRYYFTHPDHAEAFFQVSEAPVCQPSRLASLERALSCLDPGVAGFALRMLDAIWATTAAGSDEVQRQLATRVFRETIFPNVQEIALRLLLSKLERFPKNEFEDLMSLLVASRRVDSLLVWENDTPWLDRSPQSFGEFRSARTHRAAAKRQVREICTRLKDPGRASTVKPSEADAVNSFFIMNDEELIDAEALRRIALFDYSFLRADTAQLLCSGRAPFDAETSKLLDDADPRVSARGIQTCLEQWHVHSAAGQDGPVKAAVLGALKRLPVAVLTTSFLFDLGDPHSDYGRVPWKAYSSAQKKELWEVWTECMGVVLPTLAPHRLYFKDGDLFTSLQAVTKFASGAKLRALFETWIDWIEERGKVESLSDYSLAVVDTALSAAAFQADDREAIIRRCLACSRSDPIIESLKSLVDHWGKLSDRERVLVTGFFSVRRTDHAWLVAAILVRDCPAELLALLTGDDQFYSLAADDVITLLPAEILRACLGILCRRVPARGGLNVTDHEKLWHHVWHRMLFETTHPDARLVLQDLVFRIGIPMTAWAPKRRQYVKDFARLCSTADQSQRRVLFAALMALAVNSTRPELTDCWKLLYAVCTDEGERDRLADVMAEHIEALDIAQSPLGKLGKNWSALVQKRLPSDQMVGHLFGLSRQAEMPFSDSLPTIEALYARFPPRTVTVHDLVLATLKQSKKSRSAFAIRVAELRHAAFEKSKAGDEVFPEPEPDLNGWIF